MAAKGYVRPITRKQALSYRRLTPNGMGVTAIAAINGRGASKRGRKKAAAKTKAVARTKSGRIAVRSGKQLRRALMPLMVHKVGAKKSLDYLCGPAGKRKTAKKNAGRKRYGRNRYSERGAREEMRVLRGERRFSPTELRTLERGERVRRGTQEYYSPYMAGYARKGGRIGAPDVVRPNRRKTADYAHRYQKTRALLEGPVRRNRRGRRIKGMPIMAVGEEHEWTPIVVRGRRRRARRAASQETVMKKKRKSGKRSAAAKKAAATRAKKHAARVAAGKKAARTRAKKHGKRAAAARKGASKRMRKNVRRYAPNKGKRGKRKGARTYAGIRPMSVRIGRKAKRTFLYRTKSGKVKHIPPYAIAGFRSRKAAGRALAKGGKAADRYRRRMASIDRARTRASSRVRLHGDIFTPNHGIVVPFHEWSESMYANKKRGKKKGKRKAAKSGLTKKQRRSAAAKKAWRTRRAKARGGKKAHRGGKKMRKNRRHVRHYEANRRGRRHVANRRRKHYADNRRRKHRYEENRRRHYGKNRRRRSYLPVHVARMHPNRRRRHSYRRNGFSAKSFMGQFVDALKVGLAVSVGFVGHRVLSRFVSDQLLSKLGPFQAGGSMADYSTTISQILVAAIGMAGLAKVGEKTKHPAVGQANAGIFGSLVHGLLSVAADKALPQAAPYLHLSGYPDNAGRAYSGYGEYIATSGFGAPPMLSQAAAGFGVPPMLSQAAAGFGEYIATSGFGGPPLLSQAAAGTGEYIATGVQGIGDYEMSGGGASGLGYHDDGIRPNLHSAEHALNIAEAAAGVSLGDIGTKSQQWPMMQAKPIAEAPTGARAGTFAGRDGIFG